MPTFTSLAEDLLESAKKMDAYIAASNREPTSFEQDTLEGLPTDFDKISSRFVDTAQSAKRLALGPRGIYDEILFAFTDEIALRAIYTYKLAAAVPLIGTTTFATISKAIGLRVDLVERFMRQAMSSHIFAEPTPGAVSHTAASRLLVEDSNAFDAVGMMACDLSPAGMRTVDALATWPNSDEHEETGWALHNGTGKGPFQDLAEHPERARRFGAGMRHFARGPSWDLGHLVEAFDWANMEHESGTFVDVGGGHGAVSQALGRGTSNVKFIVQDLPGTAEAGRNLLPKELQSKVDFQAHNFFDEQPVKGADVYFFRWIMHNWSNKYCLRILRSLVPALKKGARVIAYEFVLPNGPEMRWTQKKPRNLDLMMLAQFNACERTAEAWRALFKEAHPRLEIHQIRKPPGGLMSIIEAVWNGDSQ